MKKSDRKKRKPKRVLRLPDLNYAMGNIDHIPGTTTTGIYHRAPLRWHRRRKSFCQPRQICKASS